MTDQFMTSHGSAPQGLRRRTVLTGAAWSVPVIAVGAPALAATASPITPTNKICQIAYYKGTDGYQQTKVSLSAASPSGSPIPAGTTMYWAVENTNRDFRQPVVQASGNWTNVKVTASGTGTWVISAETTVTLNADALSCDLTLEWMSLTGNENGSLPGGSTLAIYNYGVNDPATGVSSIGRLQFVVAERRTEDLGTNDPSTVISAHRFLTSSLSPNWPPVAWSTDGVTPTGELDADGNATYQLSDWAQNSMVRIDGTASSTYHPNSTTGSGDSLLALTTV